MAWSRSPRCHLQHLLLLSHTLAGTRPQESWLYGRVSYKPNEATLITWTLIAASAHQPVYVIQVDMSELCPGEGCHYSLSKINFCSSAASVGCHYYTKTFHCDQCAHFLSVTSWTRTQTDRSTRHDEHAPRRCTMARAHAALFRVLQGMCDRYFVLITGASRGFGKAIAEELARQAAPEYALDFVLTARSESGLRGTTEAIDDIVRGLPRAGEVTIRRESIDLEDLDTLEARLAGLFAEIGASLDME